MTASATAGPLNHGVEQHVSGKRGSPLTENTVLRAFSDVSEALSAAGREFVEILRLIARQACVLVGTRSCVVYLRNAESGLFRGRLTEGPDLDERVRWLACGRATDRFTSEVVSSGTPVVNANAQSDPRPIRATTRSWKVRSMLVVPMMASGQIVGLLLLDAPDEHDTSAPRRR